MVRSEQNASDGRPLALEGLDSLDARREGARRRVAVVVTEALT